MVVLHFFPEHHLTVHKVARSKQRLKTPATSEAGVHAAGDTKSEHFKPARVRKLNEKQFRTSASQVPPNNYCIMYGLNSHQTVKMQHAKIPMDYSRYSPEN
jgi:hypothetical protein